jgi:DNA-binding MarR family transcriptional regulator
MKDNAPIFSVFLHVMKKKIMDEHLKYFESLGLSKQHIPYMMVLSNHQEGLSQTEIVDIIKHDKAHASRALHELISLDYAYKDHETKYKNKHYLTDKGLQIAMKIKHKNDEILDEIFSVITEEEKKELEKILRKVIEHINM